LLKCLGTTRLDGGTEKRLLYRRGNRVDNGDGRLTDEVDEGLGESAQKDVDDSLFEGGEVVDIDDVREYDSEDGEGESSENRENVNPKGGPFFHSYVLTDRIKSRAAYTFRV
jgi:hypothetical protein